MSLSIILPSGVIAVYGVGENGQMPSGATVGSNYKYGTVYHIWAGGQTFVYGGDVVFWKDGSEQARLATAGGTYTLLPARLVTVDVEPIVF